MKESWTYKKFEDALQKVKYTRKLQTSEFLQDGNIPVISQEEEYISGYWNNTDDQFIVTSPVVIFGDHSRVLKYVDFNFVLGADGVKILSPIKELNAKFLYHYLKWYNVPNMGYSRHYKFLKEINLPIPPYSEQQQIVSELDLLSGIIKKQKKQIEDLDNLAQSIFYDMFGDPVTNEKGWKTTAFSNIAIFKNGINFHAGDKGDSVICIGVGDFKNNTEIKEYEEVKTIKVEGKLDKGYLLQDGDILIVRSNGSKDLVGRNMIVYTLGKEITYSGFCIRCRVNRDYIMPLFLNRILSNRNTMKILRQEGQGCNISNINQKILSSLSIILPPLSIQHEFSARIDSVESMKAKICQSLNESEELFNSRMDYYFS